MTGVSDTVIRVENLGKKYIIGHQQQGRSRYTALRDVLADGAKSVGRRILNPFAQQPSSSTKEEFWALKDVSFEIKQGDRVGIIGRNGAGKSTLLKLLSRITEPTTGRISIKGRVASLLEVGTGFHPELTGRENIYLNGAILGMSKREIRRKFDEIVDFAEIEKFLDTPVKRYSSGMYVRLAFSVAAHLEPEILVVDEVLAVGDTLFQKKCLGKMGEVSQKEGRTILFVSHNMDAVQKLCNQSILLSNGGIVVQGSIEIGLREYSNNNLRAQLVYKINFNKDEHVPAYAHQLGVEDGKGNLVAMIPVGNPWQIRIFFRVYNRMEAFVIGLGFLTSSGAPLRTSWSQPQIIEPGEYEVVFREDNLILSTGSYPLILGLSNHGITFQYIENVGILQISEVSEGVDLPRISGTGLILNPLQIKFSCLSNSSY